MNWGKVLLLIIIVSCAVIIYSINKVNHQVRTDFMTRIDVDDLKRCEEKFIAIEKATVDHSFKVVKNDPFVVIELPKSDRSESIVGEILFYCTYNADLDKHLQLLLDGNGQQMIPRSWLSAKAYIVKIGWIDHDEWHYDEKYIFLN